MAIASSLHIFRELPNEVRRRIWNLVLFRGNRSVQDGSSAIPIRFRMQPYLRDNGRLSFRFNLSSPTFGHIHAFTQVNREVRNIITARFPDYILIGANGTLRFRANQDRVMIDPLSLFTMFLYMSPESIRSTHAGERNYGPEIADRRITGLELIQSVVLSARSPSNADGLSLVLDNLLTGVTLQDRITRSNVRVVTLQRDIAGTRTRLEKTLRNFQKDCDAPTAAAVERAIRGILRAWTRFWDDGIKRSESEDDDRLSDISSLPSPTPNLRRHSPQLITGTICNLLGLNIYSNKAMRIPLRVTMEPVLVGEGDFLGVNYNIELTQPGVTDDAVRVFAARKATWQVFQARFPRHLEFGVVGSYRRRLCFHWRDRLLVDAESLYALGQWLIPAEFGQPGIIGGGGYGPGIGLQIFEGFTRANLRQLVVPILRVRLLAGVTTHNIVLNDVMFGSETRLPINLQEIPPPAAPINGRIAAVREMRARFLRELMALGDLANDVDFARAFTQEWSRLSRDIDLFFVLPPEEVDFDADGDAVGP
ncbi:hypothetical protein BDZ45DRAFT_688145 [Acephala macrosclerotiorum]|nr:hypothetical protein BDZ45DRAFT_688145 [Acephala macrosclerotiorum]